MKKHLLFLALLLASMVLKAQTVVVLDLPDPCTAQVEENLTEMSGLTIAPNPVGDELTLRFDETECASSIDITICDVKGMVVMRERHDLAGYSSRETRLSVGNLPAGMYFLNVKTEKSTFVKKIIKK